MKKGKIKLLLLVSIVFAFLILIPANVNAAGVNIKDAVSTKFGTTYKRTWSSVKDYEKYYHKIDITKKGILTMDFTKPKDAKGKYARLNICIYDKNGKEIWNTYSFSTVDSKSKNYTYKIGLDKGTYYVSIKGDFYDTSVKLSTKYKFTFSKNSECEIEPNETKETATKMTLNKMYQGYYGDTLGCANHDFYSIKLNKGQKFRLCIKNYDKLDKTTCLIDIHKPSGKTLYSWNCQKKGYDKNGNKYFEYVADEKGTYYVEIWNYHQQQIDYQVGIFSGKIDISKTNVTLKNSSVTYTGKAITQKVTVKNGNTTLKKGTDYTVSYKNNKKVGTATVTITGKGDYKGTITKSFKIVPKETTISKLTAGSKKFTVNLKKQKTETTGYEIQYSTSSNFKNSKTVKITKNTNTSKTISGLKGKTKYYVRVRTYKTVNKKTYYSSWSSVKNVTTKK